MATRPNVYKNQKKYTRKNKHKKDLVEWNKKPIFVEETTGVGSLEMRVLLPWGKKKFIEIRILWHKKRETRKVH